MRTSDFFKFPNNVLYIPSIYLSALLLWLLAAVAILALLIRFRPATANPTRACRHNRQLPRGILDSLFVLLVLCEALSGLLFLAARYRTSLLPCRVYVLVADWSSFESDLLLFLDSSLRTYCVRCVVTR